MIKQFFVVLNLHLFFLCHRPCGANPFLTVFISELRSPVSYFKLVFFCLKAMLDMTCDIVAMRYLPDPTKKVQMQPIALDARLKAIQETAFVYDNLRKVYVPPSGMCVCLKNEWLEG